MGSSPIGVAIKMLLNKNGQVAEWLKATDCKSVPKGTMVRTHPCPPFKFDYDEVVHRGS